MSQQTYNDLIDAAKNTNAIQDDTDKLVESRYAAVIASAKRARQLIDGADPVLPNAEGRKPLAIAVEELARNLVTIKRGSEVEDGEDIKLMHDAHAASSEDDYNSDSEA